MAQKIKQGNIFGRIGSGIGQGLAEQVPKEIERYRLANSLKEIGKNPNAPMFEQFANLASAAGSNPQIVQSGTEILKLQAQGNALRGQGGKGGAGSGQAEPNPFQKHMDAVASKEAIKESPSITTRNPIDATLKPYIPPTREQNLARAGQLFDENPALFKNDPTLAMQAVENENQSNAAINQALQGQRVNEQNVQEKVQTDLKNQSKALGVNLPSNVYDEIETKAIQSVKSKADGGEGLTELQARKRYGKELDAISRDYKELETIGTMNLLTKKPRENKESIRSLRDSFKKRNDLENFADMLVAKNSLSPSKAAYLAYPISETKGLNNFINGLKPIERKLQFKGYPEMAVPPEHSKRKTEDIVAKTAFHMGQTGSPLAIAEELKAKGYDPNVWIDYVRKNKKNLNLTAWQERQVNKAADFVPTYNDIWMFSMSGLDPLLEQ